jgi:DeoR family ulaG and ulaABCDEF operon transcriptional repressor
MIPAKRHDQIIELLERNRFMSIHDLAREIDSSEVTLRRDIKELSDQGLIRRVRGGAEALSAQWDTSLSMFGVPPFSGRKSFMIEQKQQIARSAAEMCMRDETIIIDGGTTTFCMAEYFIDSHMQILTNSFAIARSLMHSANQIIMPGGMLYPQAELLLDPFDSDFFANYSPSKLFMSVNGIDEGGITNTNTLVLQMEKRMIKQAGEIIILADSSKFGRRGSLFLCDFDSVDTIITDKGIPESYIKFLEEKNVKLVIC